MFWIAYKKKPGSNVYTRLQRAKYFDAAVMVAKEFIAEKKKTEEVDYHCIISNRISLTTGQIVWDSVKCNANHR